MLAAFLVMEGLLFKAGGGWAGRHPRPHQREAAQQYLI